MSSEDEIAAELERRLRATQKAPLDPVPPPKRSYSPAPTSGPVSISPVEAHLRDSLWRYVRKHAPAGLLIVALGGGAGFGGAKTQDKASDDALTAAQADLARARKELQDATLELDAMGATTRKLRRDLDKSEGARESLADVVRALETKVKTLEGAKAAVILAAPDRPPASPR